MSNNLKALRTSRNLTQEQAATLMGTTRNQYVKLERGSRLGGRRLSDVWIERAAAAFQVDPGQIVATKGSTVPLVGYVGAGSLTVYFEQQGELDEVPAPENATDSTVAVQIRGDSLGSFFNNWLVYYDDVRRPYTADLDAQLCVVGLTDGRIVIKKIKRNNSIPGLFHLYSQNEEPIYDVTIEWAAKVKTLMPR